MITVITLTEPDTIIHGAGQNFRKGSDSRRAFFLTRPPGGAMDWMDGAVDGGMGGRKGQEADEPAGM